MDRNVDRAAIVRFDEASIANEAEHFRQLRARTFEERFGQSQLASLAEGTSGESFGRSGADFGVDQAFRPAAAEQAGTSRESFGRREGDFGVDQEGSLGVVRLHRVVLDQLRLQRRGVDFRFRFRPS